MADAATGYGPGVLIPFSVARHMVDGTAFAHRMTTRLIRTCHLLIDSVFIITMALVRRHRDGIGPYRGYNSNGPFLFLAGTGEAFLT